MRTHSVIMLQIADREWTLEALHNACLLARRTHAELVLVKMIPVQHPGLLGTELGYLHLTGRDQAELDEYQTIAKGYGVGCRTLPFQYVSLVGAIVQVTDYVDARIVFATIPDSVLPIWTKFQKWALRRQLEQQNCEWIQEPIRENAALTPSLEVFPKVKHS